MRSLRAIIAVLATFACSLASRGACAEESGPQKVVVVDADAIGVAPESAAAVTRQLYATIARLGYLAVPEAAARAASASPHAGGKSPAELRAAAFATHADHCISATLGTLGERYAVSVTLAHADSTAPASKTAVTDAASLEAEVDAIARSLLPPAPTAAPPTVASTEKQPERHPTAVRRLSLNTEGAIGLTSGVNESTRSSVPTFYNQFVGPRFDYGFPNDFAIGAFIGYANLKGKEGRASNVLPYLQLEYRTRVSKTSDFRIPLRLATGYLPKNGPFFRLAAGLEFPLGGGVHLGLDIVAPALWVVRNRTLLSLDAAVEVGVDL
jgi:hypothetical protein